MTSTLDKALAGVDASRRVAWAKFYSEQEQHQAERNCADALAEALVAIADANDLGETEWAVYFAGLMRDHMVKSFGFPVDRDHNLAKLFTAIKVWRETPDAPYLTLGPMVGGCGPECHHAT